MGVRTKRGVGVGIEGGGSEGGVAVNTEECRWEGKYSELNDPCTCFPGI